MSFLTPLYLLFGLLALPILAFYMLKLRRREVQVSSTLLWQALLRDRQANTPWQRLRRNLLLLLQLLILAAFVMALARPALVVPVVAHGSVVILLDASASMNATDVKPSRFEAARQTARTLIDGLDRDAHLTLIRVAAQPEVLAAAESNKTKLRQALETAEPSQGSAKWESAFALAAGAAAGQTTGEQNTIVILSDGGLPTKGAPPLPGIVHYIAFGHSAENLAVSALSVRPVIRTEQMNAAPAAIPQRANSAQLFASVTNYGDLEQSVVLSFYANNQLFSAQTLTIAAREHTEMVIDIPGNAAIYMAQLSAPPSAGLNETNTAADALSLDDTAFTVYRPPRTGNILVMTQNPKGNFFLDQVLTAIPDIKPFRAVSVEGGKYQIPVDSFDLYVCDGVVPEGLPASNLLFINPPTNTLFEVTGIFSLTTPAKVIDSPLTQYIDWNNVHVRQARGVDLPTWADPLVQTENGPLVFAGEIGGRRVAVITFDLHDSDLPLQVTFPILFANLINYLIPAQAFDTTTALQPGDSLHISPIISEGGPQTIAIASPSNKVYTLMPGEDGLTFTDTSELGVYAVNYRQEIADPSVVIPADFFSVNLFNEAESSIRPAQTITIGSVPVSAATQREVGQLELSSWLAALGLVVLVAEWWFYHRGSYGK